MFETHYIVEEYCQELEFDCERFVDGAKTIKKLSDRARTLIYRYLVSLETYEEGEFWDAANWAYQVEQEENAQLSHGAFANVRPLGLTNSELKDWLERAEGDNLTSNTAGGLVKIPTEECSEELYVWGIEPSE
jgi:hypothetical protein